MRLRNPFIRKITRHREVAALFRLPQSEGAPVQRSQQPASLPVKQRQQVAVAALLPESALKNLPIGQIVGGTVPPAAVAAPAEAFPQMQASLQSQPSAARRQPLQTSLETAPPVSQPAVPQPSDALQADWPRLQNILRRHAQTEQSQPPPEQVPIQLSTDGSSPQPEPLREISAPQADHRPQKSLITEVEPDSSLQTSPTPSIAASPEAEAAAPKEPPLPVVEQPQEQPEDLTGSTRVGGVDQSEPSLPERLSAAQPSDVRPIEDTLQRETMISQPQPSASMPDHAPRIAQESAQPTLPAVEPMKSIHQEAAAEPPAPGTLEIGSEQTPVSAEPQSQEADESEQFLPLEAVWPVQRRGSYPPDAPTQIIQRDAGADEVDGTPPDPLENEQLRSTLEAIALAQPTDSPVEVITPRKPRPRKPAASTPVQREPADQPPEPGRPVEEAFSETPVEMLQLADNATGISQSESSADQRITGKDEPIPVEPAHASTTEPDLVETEIGPLPADLWRLLGQAPPARQTAAQEPAPGQPQVQRQTAASLPDSSIPLSLVQAQRADQPAQTQQQPRVPVARQQDALISTPLQRLPDEQNAVNLAIAAAEKTTVQDVHPARREQPLTDAASVLQRAEQPAAEQAPAQEGDTAKADTEDEAETPGVNTDELAQKVYSQIKRKLIVEWERLRKRF